MRTKSQPSSSSFQNIFFVALFFMMQSSLYPQSVFTDNTRELSTFYSIAGFSNPILQSGQYMFSLTPHYFHSANNYNEMMNSGTTILIPNSAVSTAGSDVWSYYYVTMASLYGITDEFTLSFSIVLQPKQNMTNTSGQTYTTNTGSGGVSFNKSKGRSFLGENVQSSRIIISYHPKRDVEFAFQARYWNTASYQSSYLWNYNNGSAVFTSASYGYAMSNSPAYDFGFSLVVIGN